jgi:hypothetical protein
MLQPKDQTDQWIQQYAKGRSFVDIGGIGVDSVNERISFAKASGALDLTIADIRPADYHEWRTFRSLCAEKGVTSVREVADLDIRNGADLRARVGKTDIVHCTGINYHLPSPADGIWNLRSITNSYLITNTIIFPSHIANEFGSLDVPQCGIVFCAALTDGERRVLNKHYKHKFGWDMDYAAPKPESQSSTGMNWVEGDELCCWPYWYLYTPNAFRALLAVCKLRIVDEWLWENHSMQVLCVPTK